MTIIEFINLVYTTDIISAFKAVPAYNKNILGEYDTYKIDKNDTKAVIINDLSCYKGDLQVYRKRNTLYIV